MQNITISDPIAIWVNARTQRSYAACKILQLSIYSYDIMSEHNAPLLQAKIVIIDPSYESMSELNDS